MNQWKKEEAKLFTLLPSKDVKLAALHLFLGKTAIKFQQFAVSLSSQQLTLLEPHQSL